MLLWLLLVGGVVTGFVVAVLLPTDRPPRQSPDYDDAPDA